MWVTLYQPRPLGASITKRQVPSGCRRTTSRPWPDMLTGLPSGPVPASDQVEERRAMSHKRELTALSPCSRPSSCRLLLSVRACTGSMIQPGSHRGFLMPPTP